MGVGGFVDFPIGGLGWVLWMRSGFREVALAVASFGRLVEAGSMSWM